MSYMHRFLKNVFGPEGRSTSSSFENLTEDELEAHMARADFDGFVMTEAIRPSYDLQVMPTEGYRHDAYRDKQTGVKIPLLMASVSRQKLFNVFLDLLDPLGEEVDVVLETSHDTSKRGHDDLYREHIDMPVLKSMFCDFEDHIMDDGCTGIAVLNPGIPLEVQFDEHKLLIIYGQTLGKFACILEDHTIFNKQNMKFITAAEHVHCSSDEMRRAFVTLSHRLGLDGEDDDDQDRFDIA